MKMKKLYYLPVVAAAVGLGLLGGYLCYENSGKSVKDPNAVVSRVSKMMLLPQEAATVATVTDKTRLSGSLFFRNAQNGDKVILFADSGKAILYRPSINKIIDTTVIQSAH